MSAYTVIGVWVEDEPIPVGVVAGRHDVEGGQGEESMVEFPQGVWATSVDADSVDEAETLAVEEMRDEDSGDDD